MELLTDATNQINLSTSSDNYIWPVNKNIWNMVNMVVELFISHSF